MVIGLFHLPTLTAFQEMGKVVRLRAVSTLITMIAGDFKDMRSQLSQCTRFQKKLHCEICSPTRTQALLLVALGLGFHEAPGCLARTFMVCRIKTLWGRQPHCRREKTTILPVSRICEIMDRSQEMTCLPLRKPLSRDVTPNFYKKRNIQES